MKLLLVGATGLVGQHVLGLALDDPRITQVVAVVRRKLPAHPKLLAPVVDFEQLPEDAAWWHADAVICTLGTTIRAAGSREAFSRVDKDYPLAVARLAHRQGTPCYVLNSAMGADPSSRFFYNRVKGEVEGALSSLGFRSLVIVRPGLIGGQRQQVRPAERAASLALGLLAPLLPKRLRINPAGRIAQVMLEAAVEARPGRHVVGPAELN